MNERFEEFCHTRGNPLSVDRAAGVLKGVKLLGLTSRNGRVYREEALARAATLYEGAKVNVNHAKGGPLAPRDYQDRFGRIRHVEYRPGEGLFGELHFNPKHPLSEQLLWDAEHAPEQVGFSHNVLARTSHDGTQTVVEEITKVDSVDLVADPATTRGLFEQTKVDLVNEVLLAEATLEQLRAARPDLVNELREAADLEQRRLARRMRIAELLSQYGLPMPGARDAAQQRLTSETFVESLLEATSDQVVEARIADRAALVEACRQGMRPTVTVREQPLLHAQEHSAPAGAEEFAASLKG
jgi:hypothetical protein